MSDMDRNAKHPFSRALEDETGESGGGSTEGSAGGSQGGRIGYHWDPLAPHESSENLSPAQKKQLAADSLDRVRREKRKRQTVREMKENPARHQVQQQHRGFAAGGGPGQRSAFKFNPLLADSQQFAGASPEVNPDVARVEAEGDAELINREYQERLEARPVPGLRQQQKLQQTYQKKFNPRPSPFG